MTTNKRLILADIGKERRFTFHGEFKKYGFKYNDHNKKYAAPTILLTNIQLITPAKAIPMTDHLWFNLTKGFKSLGILQIGDKVQFNGRVAKYTKGYQGNNPNIHKPTQIDYKLSHPTKVLLICGEKRLEWDEENWKICQRIYELYREDYIRRGIAKPYDWPFT